MQIGTGYMGSSSLGTSVANAEVLPVDKSTFQYRFYKFSFDNDQDCKVIINGGSPIFLRALQGWNVEKGDAPVHSFKIVESGITFNWAGAY